MKAKIVAGLGLTLIALQVMAEDKVLRVATWDSGESVNVLTQTAKLFEKIHPGVKVQIEAYGDGFDQKLAAAFGAQNPPDVTYMWNFPDYAASLEPLDDYIKKDKSLKLNDLVPGLLNYNKVGGKLYGLPAGFSSYALYYNKTMFDKAGVAYPNDNWTWDDVRAAARKIRNKEQKQFGYGVDANPDPYDLQSFLWSNGATMVSPDGKKINGYFNSPQSKQVFEMFADMVNKEEAVLFGTGDNKSYRDLFIADKLAMVVSGVWPRGAFIKANKQFGVAMLPSFKGKPPVSVVAQSAVSIAKDSKNKPLAWEFIKFYVSPEAVVLRKDTDLPVSLTVARNENFLKDPYVAPFYKVMQKGSRTPAFLLAKGWSKAQDTLLEGIQEALLKRSDIGAILDKIAKKAEGKLVP